MVLTASARGQYCIVNSRPAWILTEVVDTGVYRESSQSAAETTAFSVGKRTKANLVHDGDAGLLGGLVQLHHGGRDVARGDDVLLGPDGGLDDGRVPGVGDQADDEVVLGDLGVEGRVVAGIERDGGGALDAVGELLGRLERAAGCGGCQRGISAREFGFGSWGVPMVTGMPDAERSSRAGLATMPAPRRRTLRSRHCEIKSPKLKMSEPITFAEPS